jgi:hypothetical protein
MLFAIERKGRNRAAWRTIAKATRYRVAEQIKSRMARDLGGLLRVRPVASAVGVR